MLMAAALVGFPFTVNTVYVCAYAPPPARAATAAAANPLQMIFIVFPFLFRPILKVVACTRFHTSLPAWPRTRAVYALGHLGQDRLYIPSVTPGHRLHKR